MEPNVLNDPPNIYTLTRAQEIVDRLNSTERDGWQYKVVKMKNGEARVDVYDNKGRLVHLGF